MYPDEEIYRDRVDHGGPSRVKMKVGGSEHSDANERIKTTIKDCRTAMADNPRLVWSSGVPLKWRLNPNKPYEALERAIQTILTNRGQKVGCPGTEWYYANVGELQRIYDALVEEGPTAAPASEREADSDIRRHFA